MTVMKVNPLRPYAYAATSVCLALALTACGDSGMSSASTMDLAGSGLPDQGCGSACPCTCPGQDLGNADVVCGQDMGLTCGLTCRGENYDVDNDPKNGCEMLHAVPPGHTQADAGERPHLNCFDTNTDTILGFLLSDSRVHVNPAVTSFSAPVGSAPDYFHTPADGGAFCVDDYDVTFATSGGGNVTCYQLTIMTDKMNQTVMATGNQLVHMSSGSGSYTDNSNVYFKVEKICSLPVQEAIRYSIMYHL